MKKSPANPLTAVGITCGIGSMLLGARQAGFDVLGNLEWRKYYHRKDEEGRNTFTENFAKKGLVFKEKLSDLTPEEVERIMNPTLCLGHPECGNFSNLSGTVKGFQDLLKDAGDIPLFTELTNKVHPRFFAMDDLPKSLVDAYPMQKYHEALPDYDLYPEWISNWGYGNIQKGRKRFFMLGALRSEGWTFVPGEVDHEGSVEDTIGDLIRPSIRGNIPNNDPHADDHNSPVFTSDGKGGRRLFTWAQLAKYMQEEMEEGDTVPYLQADCVNYKLKVGVFRSYWKKHSFVLTGGANSSLHPVRCNPYSVRERARIQGFPDDFIFYGIKLESDGRWSILKNVEMIKQTGKAMPIQFNRYFSTQVAAHVQETSFESSGRRILPPNREISDAKRWYCANVGYSNQEAACQACWMTTNCDIREARMRRIYPQGATTLAATSEEAAHGAPRARIEASRPLTAAEAEAALTKPSRSDIAAQIKTLGSDSLLPGPLAQVREAGPSVDPTRLGRSVTATGKGVPVRSQPAPREETMRTIRTGTKTSSGRTYVHVRCAGCGLEERSFVAMARHRDATPACKAALEIKL